MLLIINNEVQDPNLELEIKNDKGMIAIVGYKRETNPIIIHHHVTELHYLFKNKYGGMHEMIALESDIRTTGETLILDALNYVHLITNSAELIHVH